MICVLSQFQEYCAGRGTAAFDDVDRVSIIYLIYNITQSPFLLMFSYKLKSSVLKHFK